MGAKSIRANQTIRIPITNVNAEGLYTGEIKIGSKGNAANVIVDTGSSTIALEEKFCDPSKDKHATITKFAQNIQYVGQSLFAVVVQTDVRIGHVDLPQVHVAVVTHESKKRLFGKADGILGLAYAKLNAAYTMQEPTLPSKFKPSQIQKGHVTYLKPYFSQLAETKVVANRFAFYTKRSRISNATSNNAKDPLNKGFLIIGDCEASKDLYDNSKPFQAVSVLADRFYDINLKQIIVGKGKPIIVRPPTKASGHPANCFIDSGDANLTLRQELFERVVKRFAQEGQPEFADILRSGHLPLGKLAISQWPPLTFVFEGRSGDVSLTIRPDNYWQINAPKRGHATVSLRGDNNQLKGRTSLGLPLMNEYFTIFDRSADRLGVIKFAPRR